MNPPPNSPRALLRRLFLPIASLALCLPALAADSTENFNSGWSFHRGDVAGAEALQFDASSWRKVDAPHDWAIEWPNDLKQGEGLRDPKLPGGADVGYLRGGVGWYRKSFDLPDRQPGERVELVFDGVQQEAELWVNGHFVLFHPYGYAPFSIDITDHLAASGANRVALRTTTRDESSRWYAGGGLFRSVRLRRHGPIFVETHGLLVETIRIRNDYAMLQARARLANTTDRSIVADVRAEIVAPDGTTSTQSLGQLRLPAGGRFQAAYDLRVSSPVLWSIAEPRLYRVNFIFEEGGRLLFSESARLGIRTIEVSAAQGLRINGAPVEMKGGCVHHDNGLLGAASFPDAERRRVRLLKAAGYNAIRTSHNPPSTALLDACDEAGMLVIDEFCDSWEIAKRPNGYQRYFADHWQRDLDAMVRRDFNHPSVVMWSIGNEILERMMPSGVAWSKRLVARIKELDTNRPVTNGICGDWDAPEAERWTNNAVAATHLDVVGNNYYPDQYESDHAKHPAQVMVGTESFPTAALKNWRLVEKHPYVIGDFVWTAVDYIGESGVGRATWQTPEGLEQAKKTMWSLASFPLWISGCGDIDLIGDKKGASYFRDVIWGVRPFSMLVQEDAPAGTTEFVNAWGWSNEWPVWPSEAGVSGQRRVRVYAADADRAVLSLGGVKIGDFKVDPETLTAEALVKWAPGPLHADLFKGDKSLGAIEIPVVGAAKKLTLHPEKPTSQVDGDSLIYVPISVEDAAGNVVMSAAPELTVSVSGPSELVAFGSANPEWLGSLQASKTNAWRGRALAILRVRGKGTVQVRVTSLGLAEAVDAIGVE